MIYSLVVPVSLAVVGVALLAVKNGRLARASSSSALAFTSLLFLYANLRSSSGNHQLVHSFVVCMVGLCACTFSSIVNNTARSFAVMVLLTSSSLAFVLSNNFIVQSLLWIVSALTLWLAISQDSHSQPIKRIMLFYHLPSLGLFVLGALFATVGHIQLGIFGIVCAVLVREFTFPFHSWAPRFFEKVPLGVAMCFVGPHIGILVLFQLVQKGLMPTDIVYFIVDLCSMSAVCAAVFGVTQHNVRRVIAYVIMSQSALVIFGLEQHSEIAINGSLLMWHSISLASTGFAMTIAAMEARIGPLTLYRPNGNFSFTPRIAISLFILGFASIGLPGTIGFVAEDLLVQGSIDKSPILGLCIVLATAINGITLMKLFLYLFSGSNKNLGQSDFRWSETGVASALLVLLVFLGVFPKFFLY